VDEGIIQGVALQARGYVVSRYGEGALAENKRYFGNTPIESGSKKTNEQRNLLEIMCINTWTYGEIIAKII